MNSLSIRFDGIEPLEDSEANGVLAVLDRLLWNHNHPTKDASITAWH